MTTTSDKISPAGQLTGTWNLDLGPITHGFLTDRDGTLIVFDADAPVPPFPRLTQPVAISPSGQIAGYYCKCWYDTQNAGELGGGHGFLRQVDGTIITFDPQGSTFTAPRAMNPSGEITGYYADANQAYHGFLRERDGTITTFDAPNSTFTFATAISPAGQITGSYSDARGAVHGFVVNK